MRKSPGHSNPSGRARAQWRLASNLVAFLLILVVLLASLLQTAPRSSAGPATGVERGDQSGITRGTSSLARPANSTFCGLIAPYGNALPEPDTANFFARLCVQSEFQSLVVDWGGLYGYYPFNGSPIAYAAANLTPGWGGGDGWTDIDFAINWASSSDCGNFGMPCAHQAYWLGNESTGILSGPYFETYPLACGCGEVPRILVPPVAGGPTLLVIEVIPSAVAVGFIFAVLASRRGKAGPVAPPSRK